MPKLGTLEGMGCQRAGAIVAESLRTEDGKSKNRSCF